MSPNGRNLGTRMLASDNLYTVLLAFALGVVLAAATFVAYKCYAQYDTVFKSPERPPASYGRL